MRQLWKQLSLHQVALLCLAPSHHKAGWWNCCWASPLCRQLSPLPSCEGSSPLHFLTCAEQGRGCKGHQALKGKLLKPLGQEVVERGCFLSQSRSAVVSCLCPGPCLTTVSPGRLGRSDSPFPYLSSLHKAFHAAPWRGGGG